ncbi:PREDICTED: uncharacterized protein LOC105457668 [Wasmannia auropunctata]|uniref:uncharacterized protein LOC105457668 n=1 Tax=Wasmannia auropunctata TaxID=64793 RepID=UPI0005EEEB51|nr:PREDICTED: uncharacterized protein LOC105457668 [Wasmannia auropunctata]
MMIINIIAILLLAGVVFSSTPIQGSISIINDNMILIDLRANNSNVSDDLNEMIEKLRETEKPWVRMTIDLGKKVEINGKTDLEQEYTKAGNDIENILRHVILLMQERGNNKRLNQNSIAYEFLHHVIMLQELQESINLDKNDFVFSWMLYNLEFALEMKRLISRNDLSFDYAKSVEYILSRLIKLFCMKWRQLHDDLNYISRWRSSNLKRQIESLLKNMTADNQRLHEKAKDDKYVFEDGSNSEMINNKKIKIEEATLIKQNKENLTETNKTETSESSEHIWSDRVTSKIETQAVSRPELTTHIEEYINDNNLTSIAPDQKFISNMSADVKDHTNSTFFSKITLRDEDVKKKTSLKPSGKFIDILQEQMKEQDEKQFSQLNNISLNLPTITSTLEKTDQSKRIGTLHESIRRKNGIRKTYSRRTLQTLVPSNKIVKRKNRYMPTGKIADKHRYINERMKMKNASAIDEILEAVDEVLTTDKSVEVS